MLLIFISSKPVSYNLQPANIQVHLMGKMLENDPIVDSLLAENPFKGKQPPKHVRARLVNVIIMVMFWDVSMI